jgi:hypothetical protein
MTLAELTIQIALSYDGVREVGGNNRGPEVEKFQASIGLEPGDPWCAAFVCFCIKKAAEQLGITPKFEYGGSVYKLWTRNPDLQLSSPDTNCIFLINHGLSKSGTRIGHMGFCITPYQESPAYPDEIFFDKLETMEGNTNAAGSRDGDGAYHKSRKLSEFSNGYGWLRIE